jgi:hypothetical protein
MCCTRGLCHDTLLSRISRSRDTVNPHILEIARLVERAYSNSSAPKTQINRMESGYTSAVHANLNSARPAIVGKSYMVPAIGSSKCCTPSFGTDPNPRAPVNMEHPVVNMLLCSWICR